jgi:hypothetical protein
MQRLSVNAPCLLDGRQQLHPTAAPLLRTTARQAVVPARCQFTPPPPPLPTHTLFWHCVSTLYAPCSPVVATLFALCLVPISSPSLHTQPARGVQRSVQPMCPVPTKRTSLCKHASVCANSSTWHLSCSAQLCRPNQAGAESITWVVSQDTSRDNDGLRSCCAGICCASARMRKTVLAMQSS